MQPIAFVDDKRFVFREEASVDADCFDVLRLKIRIAFHNAYRLKIPIAFHNEIDSVSQCLSFIDISVADAG